MFLIYIKNPIWSRHILLYATMLNTGEDFCMKHFCIILCWVTNYSRNYRLKTTNIYYFMVSVDLESEYILAECLSSSYLTRLQSRCQWSCWLTCFTWSLMGCWQDSVPRGLLARELQFLTGCWPEASLSSLPCVPLHTQLITWKQVSLKASPQERAKEDK